MTRVELERAFARMRRAFTAFYPPVANARLHVVNARCGDPPCASRDLAWTEGGDLYMVQRALRRPPFVVSALLAHEFGHLVDPWVWRAGSEQRADDLAELVLGRRIHYTRREHLQTFGRGLYPRPAELHA